MSCGKEHQAEDGCRHLSPQARSLAVCAADPHPEAAAQFLRCSRLILPRCCAFGCLGKAVAPRRLGVIPRKQNTHQAAQDIIYIAVRAPTRILSRTRRPGAAAPDETTELASAIGPGGQNASTRAPGTRMPCGVQKHAGCPSGAAEKGNRLNKTPAANALFSARLPCPVPPAECSQQRTPRGLNLGPSPGHDARVAPPAAAEAGSPLKRS